MSKTTLILIGIASAVISILFAVFIIIPNANYLMHLLTGALIFIALFGLILFALFESRGPGIFPFIFAGLGIGLVYVAIVITSITYIIWATKPAKENKSV